MRLNRTQIFLALQNDQARLRALGVKRLSLFGSFARDEASDSSDLDFLVELNHKTFDAFMDLRFYLEDLFHRRVDLVMTHTLKKRLRPKILEESLDVPGL